MTNNTFQAVRGVFMALSNGAAAEDADGNVTSTITLETFQAACKRYKVNVLAVMPLICKCGFLSKTIACSI